MKKENIENNSSPNNSFITSLFSNNTTIVIQQGSNSLRRIHEDYNPSMPLFERRIYDCRDVMLNLFLSYKLNLILRLRLVSKAVYGFISPINPKEMKIVSILSTKAEILLCPPFKPKKRLLKLERKKQEFAQTYDIITRNSPDFFSISFSKFATKPIKLTNLNSQFNEFTLNSINIIFNISSLEEVCRFNDILFNQLLTVDQRAILDRTTELCLNFDLDESCDEPRALFDNLNKQGFYKLAAVSFLGKVKDPGDDVWGLSCISGLTNLKMSRIDCVEFKLVTFFEKLTTLFLGIETSYSYDPSPPTKLRLPYLPELTKLVLETSFALIFPNSNLLELDIVKGKAVSLYIDTDIIECNKEKRCIIVDNDNLEKEIVVFVLVSDFINHAESFKRKLEFFSENSLILSFIICDSKNLVSFCELLLCAEFSEDQKLILCKMRTLDLSYISINKDTINSIDVLLNAIAVVDGLFSELKSLKFGDVDIDLTLPIIPKLINLEFKKVIKELILPELLKLETLSFEEISSPKYYSRNGKWEEQKRYAELKLPNLPELKSLKSGHHCVALTSSDYKLEAFDFLEGEVQYGSDIPLLVKCDLINNSSSNIGSYDSKNARSCLIDFSQSSCPVSTITPIDDFLNQTFHYNKIFNFFSGQPLYNVLVFNTWDNLNQFCHVLLNSTCTDKQKSILNRINKINISVLNVDKNSIDILNTFLNVIDKMDSPLIQLEALQFGDINIDLSLKNIVKIKELKFNNINATLLMADFSNLKILSFNDINVDFSLPDFVMSPNFLNLELFEIRSINAFLGMVSLPKLNKLSITTINFVLKLPSFSNLEFLSLLNINANTVLSDLPKIKRINIRRIDEKATLTLSKKSYRVIGDGSFFYSMDKKLKERLIIQEDNCVIS